MAEVTVGVDIGTTSVKAVAVDGDGTVVERARIAHEIRVPAPDRLEHDADAAWHDGVRAAYEEVAGRHRVAGVQVAAMVPSMCAVDAEGHALTPGLLYGDVRGRSGDGEAGSGTPDPSSPGGGEFQQFAKWCAAEAPPGARLWPAQAMANHALGGVAVIDPIVGLLAMPMFDGAGWDAAVCESIGVNPHQLPRVVPASEPVGRVGDALLGAGTVDVYAEQLCAGALAEGDVFAIFGATLIVWLATPEAVEVPGLWTVPSLTPGLHLVGGASNAGGLFMDWARRLSGAGALAPTSPSTDPTRVPVWLPYVRGERTPLHDPDLRATLADLDLTHGPPELHRAAHEASAFVLRRHVELGGRPARRVVATGGGTRDAGWMQAVADVTGLPVDTVAVPEGAALGAAFLGRVVAGLEVSDADAVRWARPGKRYEPRDAWSAATEERYARFCGLTGI